MKAKLYIGILSAMLLPGLNANGQAGGIRDNRSGQDMRNNYDYDFFYSSRINRFHRSYSSFSFYSPVFTDSYWYSYQPYTWGLSIYGGSGFGFGIANNYPIYNYYGYDYPYFTDSFSWGYTPYYSGWYSPVVIYIGIGNRIPHSYYGLHNHDYWYNDSRVGSNRFNFSNRPDNYYNSSYRKGGNSTLTNNYHNTVNTNNNILNTTNPQNRYSGIRRDGVINQQGAGSGLNGNSRDKTNNGLHLGQTRRNTNPSNPGGTSAKSGSGNKSLFQRSGKIKSSTSVSKSKPGSDKSSSSSKENDQKK